MAGHALEKVQLDVGVGHPGQRRMSQAVPHEAAQSKIINQLVPPVASRRVAVVITTRLLASGFPAISASPPVGLGDCAEERVGEDVACLLDVGQVDYLGAGCGGSEQHVHDQGAGELVDQQ